MAHSGSPARTADEFPRRDRSLQRTAVYEQTTITFGIRGPLARSDLPGLCDRVCGLLERSHATVALCDVSGIAADAVAVDALARLQLAAHRHGCQVRLRRCTPRAPRSGRVHGPRRRARRVEPSDARQSSRGGSPNSGNSRSVSRKNVSSTILPSESNSSTCSAHGSWPLPDSLGLYWPKANEPLAIGAGSTREPWQPIPGPTHQAEDVVAAGQPQVERRHRLDRVLADQRGQRLHVVALERLDVAIQQLALGRLDRGSRVGHGDLSRLDRRAGALQRAVDRGDAGVEQLGGLAGLPAQHLAQDQRGPLARRQVLERGDERQAHRLVRDGRLGRVGLDRGVGRDRLDPGDLGKRVEVRGLGRTRAARGPSGARGGSGR